MCTRGPVPLAAWAGPEDHVPFGVSFLSSCLGCLFTPGTIVSAPEHWDSGRAGWDRLMCLLKCQAEARVARNALPWAA